MKTNKNYIKYNIFNVRLLNTNKMYDTNNYMSSYPLIDKSEPLLDFSKLYQNFLSNCGYLENVIKEDLGSNIVSIETGFASLCTQIEEIDEQVTLIQSCHKANDKLQLMVMNISTKVEHLTYLYNKECKKRSSENAVINNFINQIKSVNMKIKNSFSENNGFCYCPSLTETNVSSTIIESERIDVSKGNETVIYERKENIDMKKLLCGIGICFICIFVILYIYKLLF